MMNNDDRVFFYFFTIANYHVLCILCIFTHVVINRGYVQKNDVN